MTIQTPFINHSLIKRDLNYNPVEWKVVVTNVDNQYTVSFYFGRVNNTNFIKSEMFTIDANSIRKYINSLIERKYKLGYKDIKDYPNVEDLPKFNTDANDLAKPMKCQPFTPNKFIHGMIGQGKVNGVRAIVMYKPQEASTDLFATPKNVVIRSKEGLIYNIEHIENIFETIYKNPEYRDLVFDGEIYIPNEFVTTIGGAARNPKNPKHKDICFIIFDLAIPDVKQHDRLQVLYELDGLLSYSLHNSEEYYNHNLFYLHRDDNLSTIEKAKVYILDSNIINSIDHTIPFMEQMIASGFEGAVFRDPNAEYKFGQRPKTMLKLKKGLDGEFKIINIDFQKEDNSNVGAALLYTLKNDLDDQTFMCSGIGTIAEKEEIYNHRSEHIGKFATVKYFERTKFNLPFHANVIAIRDYE